MSATEKMLEDNRYSLIFCNKETNNRPFFAKRVLLLYNYVSEEKD